MYSVFADKLDFSYTPKVLAVHLGLIQYPILSKKIRKKMKKNIFFKGIITSDQLCEEVYEKSIRSQKRERIEPGYVESEEDWEERLKKTEDFLVEFYFANNLNYSEFIDVVNECLNKQKVSKHGIIPSFNPEIAPWNMLFSQAKMYEALPEDERSRVMHHLREIIVVLTKGMLSDQLSFVAIARVTLSIKDLESIYLRRIGRGKIGGKAGGMMLAKRILSIIEEDDEVDLTGTISIPDSYFLGSDVYYEFLEENDLFVYMNQKYREFEDYSNDYPTIIANYLEGQIPQHYRTRLKALIDEVDGSPLIVRSSSLLEDNFGVAFAGKYDSVFCPNQGSPKENLEDLCTAVKRVYASVLSPDALVYRRQKDLIDYDERMAVLIQKVEGRRYKDHFFPEISGVGFSYNPIIWNPRINRDDGFLRIVVGLGTRAVDRVDNDYARMVALSHPTLKPIKNTDEVIQYSQKYLDTINMVENKEESIPADSLDWNFPYLKLVASLLSGDTLHPIFISGPGTMDGDVIITFDGLLKNQKFIKTMKMILKKLQKYYKKPVDIEFTVKIDKKSPMGFKIVILQCRQQSQRENEYIRAAMPDQVPDEQLLLVSRRMVTTGLISNIKYAVYVDPEDYRNIEDDLIKVQIAKYVGRLNSKFEGDSFVLIGPGRWGSSNIELGVPVSYADLYNARALIEIALPFGDMPPEASYGTHFFQDLVESNIFPLPIYPEEKGSYFNYNFFRGANNYLLEFLPECAHLESVLKVVKLKDSGLGREMEIVMDANQEKAIGYLKTGE